MKRKLRCDCCNKLGAIKRRQNTNYVEDKSNFAILCPVCQEENDKYWKGMWEEYYSGCL
jgi:phage FluMu protein Com